MLSETGKKRLKNYKNGIGKKIYRSATQERHHNINHPVSCVLNTGSLFAEEKKNKKINTTIYYMKIMNPSLWDTEAALTPPFFFRVLLCGCKGV